MKKIVVTLVLVLLTASCHSGGMFTDDRPPIDESLQTPWGEVEITKDAFLFGSAYPADIEIPDIDGMRSTAFVVSYYNPTGVVAVDLDSDPLKVSSKFKGFVAPSGTGFPNSVIFLSEDRGFYLTSSHVVDFNPKTGEVNAKVSLDLVLNFDSPQPLSAPFDINGDGIVEDSVSSVYASTPGGMAISNGKLYVSCANLSYLPPDFYTSVAAPGAVLIFNIVNSGLTNASNPFVITTDFNPTGLTRLSEGHIAVTNSGVGNIENGVGIPKTPSSIDVIDPVTDTIMANIPMDTAYLAYQELALTSDGRRAYIGSASYGEVYEIDIEKLKAVRTHQNPIAVTGNAVGSDYLADTARSFDDHFLFVASFDHSTVYPIDISVSEPVLLPEMFPDPFVVGFPKGVTAENPTGVNTGASGIAIRPGVPDVDYSGPDMYVLTANPGTLAAINTRGTGVVPVSAIDLLSVAPQTFVLTADVPKTQLTASIVFADGSTVSDIKDTFNNPLSGYPTLVQWAVDSDIISVSKTGEVVATANGVAHVVVQLGTYTASATITVTGF